MKKPFYASLVVALAAGAVYFFLLGPGFAFAQQATETPSVAGATMEATPSETAAVAPSETPVVAGATPEAVPSETPTEMPSETPVVAGATPEAVPSETPTEMPTETATPMETPAVLGATPQAVASPTAAVAGAAALPSAGEGGDGPGVSALLLVLAGLVVAASGLLLRRWAR